MKRDLEKFERYCEGDECTSDTSESEEDECTSDTSAKGIPMIFHPIINKYTISGNHNEPRQTICSVKNVSGKNEKSCEPWAHGCGQNTEKEFFFCLWTVSFL